MIQGIIDIGSNTIRLSIYRCEGKRIHLLLNKKTTAGLAGYAENGSLSEKGIQTACAVLSEYRDLLELSLIHISSGSIRYRTALVLVLFKPQ